MIQLNQKKEARDDSEVTISNHTTEAMVKPEGDSFDFNLLTDDVKVVCKNTIEYELATHYPGISLPDASLWSMEKLEEEGFRYGVIEAYVDAEINGKTQRVMAILEPEDRDGTYTFRYLACGKEVFIDAK